MEVILKVEAGLLGVLTLVAALGFVGAPSFAALGVVTILGCFASLLWGVGELLSHKRGGDSV